MSAAQRKAATLKKLSGVKTKIGREALRKRNQRTGKKKSVDQKKKDLFQ